jgi:hypothetical protein
MMLAMRDLEALARRLGRAAADESCAEHGAKALSVCSDCGTEVRCHMCLPPCECWDDE